MSRSGYSEDYDETFPNAGALYGANVDRSLKGTKGQAFLRELVVALDAIPDKRLIGGELAQDGAVCAIGSVGVRRGLDMTEIDPQDPYKVSKVFGISEVMAREIVFQNDEGGCFWSASRETPEQRWQRMRDWAASEIKAPPPSEV